MHTLVDVAYLPFSYSHAQQPAIHPGFAIFCFPVGIVEMVT